MTYSLMTAACILASTLFTGCARDTSSKADTATRSCFDTLLAATTADDYDQFVSVADAPFRRSITPATFHAVSKALAPRMQRGYTTTYLGKLRQDGAQVSLWRLEFADGGDDRLARMSMSGARV